MKRLILRGIDRSQIIGALVGCLLGFSVLLTGLQLYFDLQPVVGGNSGIWDPSYYILNKKVSMLENVGVGSSSFDSSEIRKIRKKPFVEDLAPFRTGNFRISASTGKKEKMPGFRTKLFFEAIPDRFMDIETGEWHWHKESEFLPIVVPSHYIALYNFGFARSQGLPKISKNAVSQVSFKISISGNSGSKEFESRIVAFSDRINSILVPWSFMEWANERFGEGEKKDPSRLIVAAADPSASELFAFAEKADYEIQGGSRKTGKLASLLDIGIGIVGGTAGIIILLAAWLLIISFRLLIIKNQRTIQKLYLLGYDLHRIGRVYIVLMGTFSASVMVGAVLAALFLRGIYVDLFESAGFDMATWPSAWTLMIALLVIIVINGANKLLLDQQLRTAVDHPS